MQRNVWLYTKKFINNKNKNINLLYSFETYTLSLLNISLKEIFLSVKDTFNPDGGKSR